MPTAPPGPASLYWQASFEGRASFNAGVELRSCPYGDERPFTRRAWIDGWHYAAQLAGLTTPADVRADESTPPPRST